MVDQRQWQNGWVLGQRLLGWEGHFIKHSTPFTPNGKKETLVFYGCAGV